MIICSCPKCAEQFEAEKEWIGQQAQCPVCNSTITIQAPQSQPEQQPVVQPVLQPVPEKKKSGKKWIWRSCIGCLAFCVGIVVLCVAIGVITHFKNTNKQGASNSSNKTSQAETEAKQLGINNNGVVFRSDVRTQSGDVIKIFEQAKFFLFFRSSITDERLAAIQKRYDYLQEAKQDERKSGVPNIYTNGLTTKRDILENIHKMLSEQRKAQNEYLADHPQRLLAAMEKKDEATKNKLLAFDGFPWVSVWNKETYSWREPGKEILGVFDKDILKGHESLAVGYIEWNKTFIFYVKPFKKNANIPLVVTITNDDILTFEL